MGVRLVATKILQYAGQRYTPGEPFLARTTDDARFLKAAGRAVDEPVKRAVKAAHTSHEWAATFKTAVSPQDFPVMGVDISSTEDAD
jgi:hypothetical protein